MRENDTTKGRTAMVSKVRCRLVVDSCCDLPRSIIDEAGVELLQFPFIMNDGEHLDDMGITMSPKEFYDRLRKGEVSGTAQIPLMTITQSLEEWAKDGTPTVYIAFTAGLSGTFETVNRIYEDMKADYPDFEFYAVDSGLASVAEGLLVYEAINQHKRGLTALQLAEWAEEARWYVNCLFTCENLESLRRGGRIPNSAARFGDKLDIKPLLAFNGDGSLSLTGVARGRKKSLKALVKCYQDDHREENDPTGTILLGHADNEGDLKWVENHLGLDKNALPPLRCDIGPVIGSHVGPGMEAIVFWGEDRRKSISISDRIASKFGKED